MDSKLNCAIVHDLLPAYVDGLTSDKTTTAINQHLADCEACSEAFRLMKEPEPPRVSTVDEIDYLKKVRRHGLHKSLIIGISVLLISFSIFAFRVFYVGFSANASDIVFDVSIEGSNVELRARTLSSGLGISRVTFSENNGMVQVRVYTAPAMFFNSGDYTTSYNASHTVGRVQMEDITLWEGGTAINRTAAKLFAARNPYAGDMPANAGIADILGVSEQFGSYTNELQTSAQPYGWTLALNDKIATSNEGRSIDKMIVDSCVMLATIDNLGYVTWRYKTDNGEKEFTFTADDASALIGYDIKSCCASVVKFQDFLLTLGIR